jgi:taurine dioxygenase
MASPATALSRLDARPLSGSLGAEIYGMDLAHLDDDAFAALYAAFVEHQVLCIRGQDLTPEQYLAFAHRWGDIHQHPYMAHLDDYPGILEIIKTESDTKAFGNGWHSDQMFTRTPAKCTMLYAKEVPEVGGDTLFANMYAAYDSLSEGMQTTLNGLRGWNTGDREKLRGRNTARTQAQKKPSQMTEKSPGNELNENTHPLVRTHADTKRKSLYMGGHTMHVDGWTLEESQPLLGFLQHHITRPEFTCRVAWEVGSLTIWDNRCVQHYAVNDYPGQRRRMHRITIQGEEVPY